MRGWLAIGGFVAAGMAAFADLSIGSRILMWLIGFIFLWLSWSMLWSVVVILDSYLFSISDLNSEVSAFANTIPAIAVLLLVFIIGRILVQGGIHLPGGRGSGGDFSFFSSDGGGDSGGGD